MRHLKIRFMPVKQDKGERCPFCHNLKDLVHFVGKDERGKTIEVARSCKFCIVKALGIMGQNGD